MVKKDYPKKDIFVEEMKIEQIGECADLFIDVFTREPWNDVYESRESVVNFIELFYNSPSFIGYVLKHNSKIIGLSIGFKKPWLNKGICQIEYYIDQFCVDANYQAQGLGKYFMAQIKRDLTNKSIYAIVLNTEQAAPAFDFYKAIGFNHDGDYIFLAIEF